MNGNLKEKVSSPILFFSIFAALMLFQTSYIRLGTITAFTSLTFTIVTAFFSQRTSFRAFRMPRYSVILTFFLVVTGIVTCLYGNFPNSFIRYIAQIILCIVLFSISNKTNYSEEAFIKKVFIVAAVFYAVLTIRSCIFLGPTRYYHAKITILGTSLDPNFIGIPFVAALVLLLSNILNGTKRLLSLVGCTILLVAAVYTASRGTILTLVIICALEIIYFFGKRNNVSFLNKLLIIALITVVGVFLLRYVSGNLSEQWSRISSISIETDNGRLELWQRAIDVWQEHPIFGIGYGGMYRDYGKATHNTYLQLLSETGLVGSVLFIWFEILMLKRAYRHSFAMFCVLLGAMIQIAFLDALDNRCFWVIICWIAIIGEDKYDHKKLGEKSYSEV